MSYDSRADTLIHAQRVAELMMQLVKEILDRTTCHDRSKISEPEVAAFDVISPRLATMLYGSEEYRAALREMAPAIQHHYERNRHHPEHHPGGIAGMTLVDVVEMLADWKAASERSQSGSLEQSLPIQRERFGIEPQLEAILRNTAYWFGWLSRPRVEAD